jgi:apolipoprotein N-acyltransferase
VIDSPADAATDTAAPATAPAATWPPRPALRPVTAVIAALAAAGCLLLSFPLPGVGWLAPVGVALLAVAVHRRGPLAGWGLGLITGVGLFVPLITWTHIVGGAVPWLLLAGMEAVYLSLAGLAGAWASPLHDRYRWAWPLVTAALWASTEAMRDRTPFGGFPWGRLAFSQAGTPMLRYAALGGAPLVTFLVALVGGLLAVAIWHLRDAWYAHRAGAAAGGGTAGDDESDRSTSPARTPTRRHLAVAAWVALGGLALVPLGLAVPTSAPHSRAVQVAIIQGNVPRLGLEFNAQRRAVLDNHVRATLALADRVDAGQIARPDLVIWPENASDIDPLIADDPADADAATEITVAADRIGAPILVGAVLEGPGANDRNAGIVWLPGAGPQSGPAGTYIKQHPVPFAEYMPMRSIARMISSRADLVAHDFLPGTTPGVLTMGPARVGDVICFEVAYDNIVRDTVTGGAQLITVQTNNADFDTAEARQQLAMVRLRAVEHGRDALMASTVGISAFVDAGGGVHNATGFNVPATEVRTLHLGDQRTLATDLGPVPEFLAGGLAVAALIAAGLLRLATRRARRAGTTRGENP